MFLKRFAPKYGSEKARWLYYQWLQKIGLDERKPYVYPQEAFKWAEPLWQAFKEDPDAEYFKVEALFPVTSLNGNVYTEDEIKSAALTIINRPVTLNHKVPLPDVQIVDAEYEDEALEVILKVMKNSEILQKIKNGEILHVSIDGVGTRGVELHPEGKKPVRLVLTGLALLDKNILPGIPLTRILPAEKLIESINVEGLEEPVSEPYPNEHACRLVDPDKLDIVGSGEREHEGKKYRVIFGKPKGDPNAGTVEQAYRYPKDVWSVEAARAHCEAHGGIEFSPASNEALQASVTVTVPLADARTIVVDGEKIMDEKTKEEAEKSPKAEVKQEVTQPEVKGEPKAEVKEAPKAEEPKPEAKQEPKPETQEAEWDAAYINDLPDAAFAYIAPGGKKDDQGKTVPRSLRYLPHHNKSVKDPDENDSVDIPHLRNALARVDQTDLPAEAKAKARAHLEKHAKALLASYQNEEKKPLTSEEIVNLFNEYRKLGLSKSEAYRAVFLEILKRAK